jgi:hypothetical protein
MTHISRFERSQLLLLPEAIYDYVAADNTFRLIDAFVDGLDLKSARFERVKATCASAESALCLEGRRRTIAAF